MRYTFGAYILDTQQYELYRAGIPLQLQPKICDLLAYLIQHCDRVVTRQELFDTLWPEDVVSDDALEWVVSTARRVVGDSGRAQQVIKTIRNRGYRWMIPVINAPLPASDTEAESSPVGASIAEQEFEVPRSVDDERKLVTVLTGALVQTEAHRTTLDPEALLAIRRRFFTLAQQEVQRYEGIMQHIIDDRFLAFFGIPLTHEDHAQRAVLTALHFQEHLGRPQHADERFLDGAWTVRMALHTGEVVLSQIGESTQPIPLALGDTIHTAEQLLQMAAPGTIMLSDATRRLVQGNIVLETTPDDRHGTRPLFYKVLGMNPPDGGWRGRRILRHLVGRKRDMATLQALLSEVEVGRGQIVGVVGEAGIGKSRLLYEFRQQVQGRSLTYLAGRCLSYAQATPYFPLMDILRQVCHLNATDTPESVMTKVRRHLGEVGMDAEAWTPYMLRLLQLQEVTETLASHSSQVIRTRIFEMLIQMSLQMSLRQPLLLEIEDLHWIDPTSEAWLAALIERLPGVPLLLLLSYRSGYRPTWMDKSYATQLALQRLTADESRQLVQAVFVPKSMAPSLLQDVIAKANGNPFFLEELAQTVGEQTHRRARPTVPETIQAVLAARFDLLPPEAKSLLQMAAVIGTEVSGPLLQMVSGLAEATLRQHLGQLQGIEFLFEIRPLPELTYAFKHVLTQEVVYQYLLRQTRQQLHDRTAQVLVDNFAYSVEASPELVAHHYTEAGLSEQAVAYWHQAGQKAIVLSAYTEAIAHLSTGLSVLTTLPDTPRRAVSELPLQLSLGFAHQVVSGYSAPATEQAFVRAHALCQVVNNPPQYLNALRGLSMIYFSQGKGDQAQALTEQYLTLAQCLHDPEHGQKAHTRLGLILLARAELATAQAHLEQSLALYDPQQFQAGIALGSDPGVDALAILSLVLWRRGYPDQALERIRQALALARERAHPWSLVNTLDKAARLYTYGDWQALQASAEAMRSLVADHKLAHFWASGAIVYQGYALVMQGQIAEGLPLMRQEVGARPELLRYLVEACWRCGMIEEGLTLVAEWQADASVAWQKLNQTILYWLKGELLLAQAEAQQAEAERCWHHALDLACQNQDKWLELKVSTSLSRLWQRQGKRQEGYDLLAPVYGWFTEGFDTSDLQTAKALLHQLSTTP